MAVAKNIKNVVEQEIVKLFKTLFYWLVVGGKKSIPIKIIGLALLGGSWNIYYSNQNISLGLSADGNNEILSVIVAITGLLILIFQLVNDSKKKAIIIQHTGIAEIPTMDIDSARPIWDRVFKANTINIECDRYYKNGIVTDPKEMLEQTKSIKQSIENNTRKISPKYLKLYYGGLVQVPFAFIAGVIFDNTKNINVYDWDRNKEQWYEIKDFKKPPIKINIEHPKNQATNEIAIEIAISYDIARENTIKAVGNKNIPVLKIIADKIEKDNTINLKSQKYIAQKFHKILDQYAYLDKIHVFVATQNSMVFNLGRQVNPRVHSPIILIWQYERHNKLKNPWAVAISNTMSIHKCKTRTIIT